MPGTDATSTVSPYGHIAETTNQNLVVVAQLAG